MEGVIRPIRPDEGRRFRSIRLEAIAESPTAFGSTLAELLSRPPEYWDQRAANGAEGPDAILLVAEEGDRWVGIVGGFMGEEAGTRYVDLISMWVHPASRGRGIGRRLIRRLVAWAREHGARCVVLWVTENNEAATALYRRAGFRETGERQPHPWHGGLDEVRMVREI